MRNQEKNQVERMAEAYRAATIEGAWHGPAIAELLAGITEEMAAAAPVRGMPTIATLLQHMLLWNERVCDAIDGHPMPKCAPEKDWVAAPIPWPQLKARWNESRDLLEERIRNFPEDDLAKPAPGRDYPYTKMLSGITQHAIWHGGQIAMLRSLAGGK